MATVTDERTERRREAQARRRREHRHEQGKGPDEVSLTFEEWCRERGWDPAARDWRGE